MKISCRARVAPQCYEGKDEKEVYPDGMLVDSTYEAMTGTVCCDACYMLIDPFMRPNKPNIPAEADRATAIYIDNRSHIDSTSDEDLPELLAKAEYRAACALPGGPAHESAMAAARMVWREMKDRGVMA